MSTNSSPRKLSSKPSLSILSSSSINQLNNSSPEFKPIKERVISESTGLIKFSLGKTSPRVGHDKISEESTKETIKNALPIYVPIDSKQVNHDLTEEELLFQMAAKQRGIMELTNQLKQANQELHDLEEEYKRIAYKDTRPNLGTTPNVGETSAPLSPRRAKAVPSSVRKSTSILNISLNPPSVNTEQFIKTQKQMTDTFNQISNNIQNSEFINKSRSFFQTSLNKNLQMGNQLFNSIFEKNEDESSNDDEVLIDQNDHTQNYDYSVDFDIEKLNKINFNSKLNGTILKELEDVDEVVEEDSESVHRSDPNESMLSEEDYGGEAVPI